jgi:hypothetical protein
MLRGRLRTTTALLALLAAGAAATPDAKAADEVVDRSSGVRCADLDSAVEAGGCKLRLEGEQTLFFHFFGLEATEYECRLTLVGRIDGAGRSEIARVSLSDGGHLHVGKDCPVESPPCLGSLPWRGASQSRPGAVLLMKIDMCIQPQEGAECSGPVPLRVLAGRAKEEPRGDIEEARIGPSSLCEVDIHVLSERSTFAVR